MTRAWRGDSERKAGWLILLFFLVLGLASLHSGCAGGAVGSSGKPGGPTVSITSPTSGATLSGTLTVTATASSTIGIAGVQFLLDGANLGAEVTTTPYSYSWDTTTTSNGAHTLAARARDTGGTTASSVGVTLTVSNGSGGSTFQTRCAAPGVIRCVGFDSAADISGVYGSPTGVIPGETTPVIDPTVKASGNGSLKFTIPANSGSDSSGTYFANFSDDLATQFDSGGEFYVQWRQRFSPEFITTRYAGGGGWKQAIIGKGDNTGCSPSFTANCSTSCTNLEVVTQNTYHYEFPQMYHSCGIKDGVYEPLVEPIPNTTDFLMQNGIRNPPCLFSTLAIPPCLGYVANQWMTFQVHVKVGTWYTNNHVYHHDSTVQMWVAKEGQPSVLVFDFSPQPGPSGLACQQQQVSEPACQTGYDLVNDQIGAAKYGKVWLLPYNTGKDPTVTNPIAYTWYDELIISRNKIADP